jgi:hypothetical protein
MKHVSLALLMIGIILLPGCWEGSCNRSSCVESNECSSCPGEFPPARGTSYEEEMNEAQAPEMSPEMSDEDMLLEENFEMEK